MSVDRSVDTTHNKADAKLRLVFLIPKDAHEYKGLILMRLLHTEANGGVTVSDALR